jgi:hypothetical protein
MSVQCHLIAHNTIKSLKNPDRFLTVGDDQLWSGNTFMCDICMMPLLQRTSYCLALSEPLFMVDLRSSNKELI